MRVVSVFSSNNKPQRYHTLGSSVFTSCCNSELTSFSTALSPIFPQVPSCANVLRLPSTGPFFLMLHEAAVASSQANRSSIRSHSHHPLCLGGVAIWLCPVPWSLPIITDYSSPEEVHIIACPYIWVWKSPLFMGPDRLQLYACEPGGFSPVAPLLAVSHWLVLNALQMHHCPQEQHWVVFYMFPEIYLLQFS